LLHNLRERWRVVATYQFAPQSTLGWFAAARVLRQRATSHEGRNQRNLFKCQKPSVRARLHWRVRVKRDLIGVDFQEFSMQNHLVVASGKPSLIRNKSRKLRRSLSREIDADRLGLID